MKDLTFVNYGGNDELFKLLEESDTDEALEALAKEYKGSYTVETVLSQFFAWSVF